MDSKAYLDQISASVRPTKPSRQHGILSSPIFKVSIGGLIALIFIIILGSVLGGTTSAKDEAIELNLYINNTMQAISDYQPSLKSSNLRSASASLYSVLSNTTRDLSAYLDSAYGSDAKATATMESDAALHLDGLTSDLFEAKINGILDRIYAHKMSYEISIITSKESSLYTRLSDDTAKSSLGSSYNSLQNLYDEFNNFSETK